MNNRLKLSLGDLCRRTYKAKQFHTSKRGNGASAKGVERFKIDLYQVTNKKRRPNMTIITYRPGSLWGASRKYESHKCYKPPSRNRTWKVHYDTQPGPCVVLTTQEIDRFMSEVAVTPPRRCLTW